MVYNTVAFIAGYLNISEKKTLELLNGGIIPHISTGNIRKYYYTSNIILDYVFSSIQRCKNKTYDDIRSAFTEKGLVKEDIFTSTKKSPEIITITNQKGGVGKTTSAVNIGSTLSFMGKKVLLVDMDAQSQTSRYFKKVSYKGNSILNIIEQYREDKTKINEELINKYIVNHEFDYGNIDILPSELRLSKMLELSRVMNMPHLILNKILDNIKHNYDYIIIDTPPYSGLSLEMSIFASDKVLLATEAETFSLEGLNVTVSEIKEFKEATGKNIKIDGIIVNTYEKRVSTQYDTMDEIYEIAAELDLESNNVIVNNKNSIISNSQKSLVPILEYVKDAKIAIAESENYFLYCKSLILGE
jgi:chromosome partitioning protein